MSTEKFDLQVMIPSGPEAVERATLGFATALAAASAGDEVVVFLTMQGAHWAAPTHDAPQARGFECVAHYMDLLIELGARIEACTSCVDNFCQAPLNAHGEKVLREGLVRAGLSVAAMRASSTSTAVF